MAAPRRLAFWLAGLCGALTLVAGCNVFSTMLYVFGPEQSNPPVLKKLASDDNKEVKVVIWAYTSTLENRPEFLRIDRELTAALYTNLHKGLEHNEEKVCLASPQQVERFKSETPNWKRLSLDEIGKHFQADYVICLEIESVSLYEMGSSNQLYRGRIEVNTRLVDVNEPEEVGTEKSFTCIYPSESKGPIPAGDSGPQQFKQAFLSHAGQLLSWYFTAHPVTDEMHMID